MQRDFQRIKRQRELLQWHCTLVRATILMEIHAARRQMQSTCLILVFHAESIQFWREFET